jgi:hypothetical protein
VGLVKVFVRRFDGGVEEFPDVHTGRSAARVGDIVIKVHRGGHVEHEVAETAESGEVEFVERPPTNLPR